ncbi:MAG TPA: TetR/AcrR family transcriptional regulator [Acidimicrobiales bacterium]|nr:TetR/AcrR family transcriptional regulator [Acidimicrobiales bacterium]
MEEDYTDYTDGVTPPPASRTPRRTLREEQVAETRSSLVASGRRLFGEKGFAATSVEDLAREARVTTGALYHHFPTKTALFESVFEQVHGKLLEASARAAAVATDEIEALVRGFEAFLDSVLEPDVQRIIITDAPAVLGLSRFTELDERYAFAAIVAALEAAVESGKLRVDDPETLARLLLGALTRGGMLIASSPDATTTRDAVATVMRDLLEGLSIDTRDR